MSENENTIITGFHAIDERLRKVTDGKKKSKNGSKNSGQAVASDISEFTVFYSKIGPRVKKTLETAKTAGIVCKKVENKQLDLLVSHLDETAQDHRGIVLSIAGGEKAQNNVVDFDMYVEKICTSKTAGLTIVLLDSVTDPHNVGAIIRSCDQLSVDLLVIPESNSPKESEIIGRSSAGANAWIPVSIVPNLSRAVQKLQDKGFWVYGADAGGEPAPAIKFPKNTALILGSEGNGIHRLLKEKCDTIVSIPTSGKLDSLNVSVAAGVLMYEIYRQRL